MSMIKIISPDGKYALIADRDEAGKSLPPLSSGFSREPGTILRVSSTVAQPFICANYDAEGHFVGGRTYSEVNKNSAITALKEKGFRIEEITNA